MENDLKSQLNRYKYIIENLKDVIWEMNSDFAFTFLSPNAKNMAGYEAKEMIGRKITEFLVEDSKKYLIDQVSWHLNEKVKGNPSKTVLHDLQFICKNGLVIWVEVSANLMFEEGRFIGYIGTTRDITEKKGYERQLSKYLKEMEAINVKLEQMAVTDILTGVYNRRKFDDDINLIIKKRENDDIPFSLALFDIDHFKAINDLLGHKMGDRVLKRISDLVMENIRATDRVFRWGGDEFIIILPEANLEGASAVAEKIRYIIENEDFGIEKKLTISLGVGEYLPQENADQMIARIDKLMYQAKLQGRNRVVA